MAGLSDGKDFANNETDAVEDAVSSLLFPTKPYRGEMNLTLFPRVRSAICRKSTASIFLSATGRLTWTQYHRWTTTTLSTGPCPRSVVSLQSYPIVRRSGAKDSAENLESRVSCRACNDGDVCCRGDQLRIRRDCRRFERQRTACKLSPDPLHCNIGSRSFGLETAFPDLGASSYILAFVGLQFNWECRLRSQSYVRDNGSMSSHHILLHLLSSFPRQWCCA